MSVPSSLKVSSFSLRQEEREQEKRVRLEPIATSEFISWLKRNEHARGVAMHKVRSEDMTDEQVGQHLKLIMGHGYQGCYVNWSKVVEWLKEQDQPAYEAPAQRKLTLVFPDTVREYGETYIFVWLDEDQLAEFRAGDRAEEDIIGIYTHIERGADDVLEVTHKYAMQIAETPEQTRLRRDEPETVETSAKFAIGDHVIYATGFSGTVIQVDKVDPERVEIEYFVRKQGWTYEEYLTKTETPPAPISINELMQAYQSTIGITSTAERGDAAWKLAHEELLKTVANVLTPYFNK